MDDEARLQLAPTGDGGFADLDGADRAAFCLDLGSAGPRDRTRHPAAELQIIVGRIDDGVDILLGQVALQDLDG
jgi:hypothetical protein